MRSIDELKADIERLEGELRQAREALFAAKVAQLPLKVGDILKGRKGDARISKIVSTFGSPSLITQRRKKDGTWGSREHHFYSWDIQNAKVIGHEPLMTAQADEHTQPSRET